MASGDEHEQAKLEHLMSKEGADDYKALVNETTTYADLLRQFPVARAALAIEYLIDHIPRIKPRLYSIASSADMHPGMVQLCIVKGPLQSLAWRPFSLLFFLKLEKEA